LTKQHIYTITAEFFSCNVWWKAKIRKKGDKAKHHKDSFQ
jgi:hypothetical protein